MKTNKMNRLLALVLALVLVGSLALSALADTVIGDLNGDGKVTVFDAQLLLESQAGLRQLNTDVKLLDIIKSILGGMPGAYDTDNDGVIEIYSASGLKQISANPAGSYKLMNDIDMQGANWIPLAKFTGKFDGNGKTISNVNIPYSVSGLHTTNPKKINQGFFGDTSLSAVIRDVNFENITVTATEEAEYIGLVIGSNRGVIENVNVTGTIIDTRETYETNTYIGVAVGRICNPNGENKAGTFVGGAALSITDDAGVDTTTGLTAKAVLQIANRDELNKTGTGYNKIGLVGWHPDDAIISGIWAETTNDTDLQSAKVQANRAEVIRYMNEMSTIQWTPTKDLKWVNSNGESKTYKAGVTYTGLPYTHNNGSLERFQSILDENGYVLESMETGSYVAGEGYFGWVQYAGNNCSTAVNWSWLRVSNAFAKQQPTHTTPYHGGHMGNYQVATATMIPTEDTRANRAIYAVGNWDVFSTIVDGKRVDAEYDDSKAAYTCTDEKYTGEVLQNNGLDTMLEAYAMARGGDAMVAFAEKWNETLNNAGHARLLAADTIVIRDKNGVIDQNASYVITTEQGGGGVSRSTWRTNWKYSLRELLDDSADSQSTGYWNTYIPITIRALQDDHTRGSYTTIADPVTNPYTGRVFSNYRINSTIVTIMSGNEVVCTSEVFTGVGPTSASYSGHHQAMYLDGHKEAVQSAGLVAGQTYTFSVQVLTSDGKLHDTVKDQTFIAE